MSVCQEWSRSAQCQRKWQSYAVLRDMTFTVFMVRRSHRAKKGYTSNVCIFFPCVVPSYGILYC